MARLHWKAKEVISELFTENNYWVNCVWVGWSIQASLIPLSKYLVRGAELISPRMSKMWASFDVVCVCARACVCVCVCVCVCAFANRSRLRIKRRSNRLSFAKGNKQSLLLREARKQLLIIIACYNHLKIIFFKKCMQQLIKIISNI